MYGEVDTFRSSQALGGVAILDTLGDTSRCIGRNGRRFVLPPFQEGHSFPKGERINLGPLRRSAIVSLVFFSMINTQKIRAGLAFGMQDPHGYCKGLKMGALKGLPFAHLQTLRVIAGAIYFCYYKCFMGKYSQHSSLSKSAIVEIESEDMYRACTMSAGPCDPPNAKLTHSRKWRTA